MVFTSECGVIHKDCEFPSIKQEFKTPRIRTFKYVNKGVFILNYFPFLIICL